MPCRIGGNTGFVRSGTRHMLEQPDLFEQRPPVTPSRATPSGERQLWRSAKRWSPRKVAHAGRTLAVSSQCDSKRARAWRGYRLPWTRWGGVGGTTADDGREDNSAHGRARITGCQFGSFPIDWARVRRAFSIANARQRCRRRSWESSASSLQSTRPMVRRRGRPRLWRQPQRARSSQFLSAHNTGVGASMAK